MAEESPKEELAVLITPVRASADDDIAPAPGIPGTPDMSPSQTGPTVFPDPASPTLRRPSFARLPFPKDARSESSTQQRWHEQWTRREYHHWKAPLLMVVFWLIGIGCSVAHCTFYSLLQGTIVPGPGAQENNLRFGTAFAFLSQIALSASVWQTYTQWIWRSIRRLALKLATLNDIFGADTSVLWVRNYGMLRRFTVGYLIALYAWTLMLPPFFTPGTLFIYEDIDQTNITQGVPYLTIANSSFGHNYSYSPDYYGDLPELKANVTKDFKGPRTILTLLTTATAAGGQILPIKAPYNHSSYSLSFVGPSVRCSEANPETKSQVDTLLATKMATPVRTSTEARNAYYAFVPAFDAAGEGNITALADARYQASLNISNNQIWMVFERYNFSGPSCDTYKYYQTCQLWNSTYDLTLSWDHGFQNISGHTTPLHEVAYPNDQPGDVSNMAQHAYSAFMWALSDQVVGSFGWFTEPDPKNSSLTKQFGLISSPVQHNVLLGSSDLAVFFGYNERNGSCHVDLGAMDQQRQQDIELAKNRTMSELIEELSFNMTVSLMHNDLLTRNVNRVVTRYEDVNRYGYSKYGLFVPYALACLFTTVTAVVGLVTTYRMGGAMPDKKFQDILAAADDHTIAIAKSGRDGRRQSVKAEFNGRSPTFRAETTTAETRSDKSADDQSRRRADGKQPQPDWSRSRDRAALARVARLG
ncbi:hypothetical protein B0H66DRAFT_593988 [Apodospora peruviana]|uniref:Uncharacterized protein n=1 Tax=Apodospora peruviana TaxID=516989 RepID=A0AAE0HYU6_9PEZI|nr:hypothetical protein B0H66DRAFT_593988 [Apodospora peruviana]